MEEKQKLEIYFTNNSDEDLYINHTFEKSRIVIDFADQGNEYLMLRQALVAQNILTETQINDLIDSQQVMRTLTKDNSDIRQNSIRIAPGDSMEMKYTRTHSGELD